MKITKFEPKDAINGKAHRRENAFTDCYQIVVFNIDKVADYTKGFTTPVDLRLYNTNAKSYACIWINENYKGINANGSGSASGYGYDRPSAAASEALASAGIELSEDISGRGMSCVERALDALAKHLGYETYFINHTHA